MQEPTFWRNYFYRVTLAKQTVLSNPPAEQESKKDGSVLFDFKDESDTDEAQEKFDLKDDSDNDELIVQEKTVLVEKKAPVVVEVKETKEENYEGMEDWEIELRKAAI